MIATCLTPARRARRVGGVQPLSALMPAVLRQYGIEFAANSAGSPAPLDDEAVASGDRLLDLLSDTQTARLTACSAG